jgi:gliding motility-associated-like protein
MRNLLLSFILFSTGISLMSAQNCSINAGLSTIICLGDTMSLNGTRSGLLTADSICTWTQISGPSRATIVKPHSLNTLVNNYTSGRYTFLLTMKCLDGYYAEDSVSITIPPLTVSNAGRDTIYCPGTYRLNGNAPQNLLENGVWTIVGYNQAGVTLLDAANPQCPFTLNSTNSGMTKLRWTIINNTGCISMDEVVVTNRGGISPVDAGPDQYLNNCFSTSTCAYLAASNGGDGFGGQTATWSFVSGPSVPTFTSNSGSKAKICDLIEGTYIFRYTVAGPCVNGSDEVMVVVPASSQNVSLPSANALGLNTHFCGLLNTVTLTGNPPEYAGESVQWIQESGPTVTITNPASPTTTVTNITQGGEYCFNYKIYNSVSGCSGKSSVCYIFDTIGFVDGGPDQILPCDVTSTSIPVKASNRGLVLFHLISGPPNSFRFPTNYTSFNGLNGLTVPGTYRVEMSLNSGDGCPTVYDYVDVTVSRPPTGANAGSNQNFACVATSTQLAGNNPILTGQGTGHWSQISGPNQATLATPDNYICDVKNTVVGAYKFRWTISGGNNCPTNYDDITVIIPDSSTTKANAGADKVVCYNSPVSLSGNNFRADETAIWTSIPGGVTFSDKSNPSTTASGLAPNTTYTFIYTITNSCGLFTRDTVKVTTTAASGPSVANAGANQCLPAGTADIQLHGNIPTSGIGTWTKLSGPACTISNTNSASTTVTNTSNGTYQFVWTISATGCANATMDTVTATISAATTPADAGADVTVCASQVTLHGNTPSNGTGAWTQIDGDGNAVLSSPTFPSPTVSNLFTGAYTYRWTISNGACPSTEDDVTLRISSPPSTAIGGADINMCNIIPSGINLDAASPASGVGQWVQVSGPNEAHIVNPSLKNALVYGFVSGNYIFRWTVTGGPSCAQSTDDIALNISEPAKAGNDQKLCNAIATQLTGNFGSSGIWSQVFGPSTHMVQVPGSRTATVDGLTVGSSYTFRYTIPAIIGCPSTFDDVVVTNGVVSTPNAGIDDAYCNATSFKVNGNPPAPGETGVWSILSGPTGPYFADATRPDATMKAAIPGTYILSWTLTNGGCNKADVKRIDNYGTPSQANAGVDKVVCTATSMLIGNTPVYGIGTWRQISGPSNSHIDAINNPSSEVTGLIAPGTYKYTWTITNGSVCSANTDTVAYVVPSTSNAGADQEICEQSSAELSANIPVTGTGTWTKVSGPAAVIASPHNPSSTVTSLAPGAYQFAWTIVTSDGGCYSSDTVTIINSIKANESDAGKDDTLCGARNIILKGNAPIAGASAVWTQVSGPRNAQILSPLNATSPVNGLVTGTYIFAWTISTACSSSTDEVSIIILNGADIANAGPDQKICATTAFLDANTPSGTNQGEWFQYAGPTTTRVSASTTPEVPLTNLIPGTYKFIWKISNGKCSTADTMALSVNPAATVEAGSGFSICNNIPGIQLLGSNIGGAANNATWSIVAGQGSLNTYSSTPTPSAVIFTPQNGYTGQVILQLTAHDACHTVTDERVIQVDGSGTAYEAKDDKKFTDPNTPVTVDILGNDVLHNVFLKDSCNQSTIINPPSHGSAEINMDGTVTYTPVSGFTGVDSFRYKLCDAQTAVSAGSCYNGGKDNAWVVIYIEGCIIPNSFSPDGDGINDVFEIPCATGDVNFRVYNRWGIEVYRNERYQNDWDGTYKGSPLPDGTYYYSLNYLNNQGEDDMKEGFITIHR